MDDFSDHIVCEFRVKAEELRKFASSQTVDPWRQSIILNYARDCEIMADAYEDQVRKRTMSTSRRDECERSA